MATSAASLQKMMINAQKTLTKMQINAQKDIQKMSDKTSAKTLEYNKQEAALAREWQTEMSNTSHQREVKDLKKAGLNPVLSATGGGGAASYTTSAASAQAENPSNAIASMMSALMGSLSSLSASQMSATSQQYAADKSAAAQLKAARASAAATRYAADRAAAASNYAADMQYKIAMEKPQTNPFSIVDKYLGGNKDTKNNISKFLNNPEMYLSNKAGQKVTQNNFSLSNLGRKFVNAQLRYYGADQTASNRKLWVKSFIFGNQNAAKSLKKARSYSQR